MCLQITNHIKTGVFYFAVSCFSLVARVCAIQALHVLKFILESSKIRDQLKIILHNSVVHIPCLYCYSLTGRFPRQHVLGIYFH